MSPDPRPSLFIDASAWVALEYPKEAHHDAARAFLDRLKGPDRPYGHLHTGLIALVEAHGWLLHHAGPAHAGHLLSRVERGVVLHGVERETFWAAAARLGLAAAGVELADALIAVLMDRVGIRHVWSYDDDFEALGYPRVG